MSTIWIDKPKRVGDMWQIRFRRKEPGYKPKYETWPVDEYSEQFVANRVKDLKAEVRLGNIDPWRKELSAHSKNITISDAVNIYMKKIDVVDNTMRMYKSILSGFSDWYGGSYLVDSVSEGDLTRFTETRCSEVNSHNAYIGYLNSFMRWCQDEGYLEKEVRAAKKKMHHKKFPAILTEDEFWKIFSRAESLVETDKQERSLYTLPVYFYTGIRKSELPKMKVSDFLISKQKAVVGSSQRVKGKKSRSIYLPPECHDYVARLSEGKLPYEPIFDESHTSKSTSAMQVAYKLFRDAVDKEFPKRELVFHSLRHSCACWMLTIGLSIMFVKEQLGHAKIETTMIYARMTGMAFDSELDRIGR